MSADNLESLSDNELRKKFLELNLPNVPITDQTRGLIIKRLRRVMLEVDAASATQSESKRRETIHVVKQSTNEANATESAARPPSRTSQRRTLAATPTKMESASQQKKRRLSVAAQSANAQSQPMDTAEIVSLITIEDDDDDEDLIKAVNSAEQNARASTQPVVQTVQAEVDIHPQSTAAARGSPVPTGETYARREQVSRASPAPSAGTFVRREQTSRASPAPTAASVSRQENVPRAAPVPSVVAVERAEKAPAGRMLLPRYTLVPGATSILTRRPGMGGSTVAQNFRKTLGGPIPRPNPLARGTYAAQIHNVASEEYSDDADKDDKPFASEFTRRLAEQYKNQSNYGFQKPHGRAPRTVAQAKANQGEISSRKYVLFALVLIVLILGISFVYYYFKY